MMLDVRILRVYKVGQNYSGTNNFSNIFPLLSSINKCYTKRVSFYQRFFQQLRVMSACAVLCF